MEPRLCLVVIRVNDLERSRRFYEALGLSFSEERHGQGPLHLACDLAGTVFEIYPAVADQPGSTATRLGFRLANVQAAQLAAMGCGGITVSPPKPSSWGKRAVVCDPDAHFVELLEQSSNDGNALSATGSKL